RFGGFCLLVVLAMGLGGRLHGQQPAAESKLARLPVIFDERMADAPVGRFKPIVPGESEWKADTHWIVKAPAGYVLPVRAGRDAHLAVKLTFPRLAREGEMSETRLGLVYLNNTVGVVAMLRTRKGDRTLGEIHVMSQPDIVGPVSVTRRSIKLEEDLPSGEWTLAVRSGALTIACDGKELGRASLETKIAPIIGTAIAQPSAFVTVERMTLRATSFPADLSAQQREQGIAASTLNGEVGQLLRSRKYEDAIPKAHQVVAMYKKLHGAEHPDVANALFNLAMVYKHDGQSGDAVKYLKEALKVRQALFGEDHPDTAQIEMELTVLLVDRKELEEAFPHCLSAHFSYQLYYGDDNRTTIVTRQMLDKLPRPKREDET
ncbi:MAG TPA: tetratricopeptide repeat protein, partial [Pirellulaceae bacterium]|nr:tetratricopeptide repeat protein [Pirellulaceae bacterium]